MKNKNQMRKNLQSTKNTSIPVRILEYQNNYLDSLKEVIAEIIAIHGVETEIMLLGRNNFDVNNVLKSGEFVKKGKGEQIEIVYKKHPNIKLFFLTTHRAKGLEADNSILLNAQNSKSGFPNKMVDDPLLSWVLTKSDRFEFAEERRLFYVAITRTKNTTYILAPENKQSHFVKELKSNYDVSVKPVGQSVQLQPHCPRCQTGHLVLRSKGKYGSFLGCTNYPQCDYTLNSTDTLINPKICTGCGGYMVKRKGMYGSFYGCSHFPTCRSTVKVEEEFCR